MQRALFGSATRNLDIKQLDVVKRCQAHINENGRGWIKCVRVSPSPWIFNCRFFNRDSSKASKECTGSRADWDARFMKVFAAEIFEMRLACQIVLADYKQSKSSKKCSATISAFLKTREGGRQKRDPSIRPADDRVDIIIIQLKEGGLSAQIRTTAGYWSRHIGGEPFPKTCEGCAAPKHGMDCLATPWTQEAQA